MADSASGSHNAQHTALVGAVVDGRYRVDAFIARGGMATVYRATDLRLERSVALKIMHGALAEDGDFVARFVREARSAARLNHPAIVGVFDQGESDGLVYLAMEYVDGETLRDKLAREGRLGAHEALTICEPVLEALGAAHDAGIAHRDIKPENVLISADGRVKVADFGLARAIVTSGTSGLTQGLLIGTVSYLAPEQVEKGTADARTDVYAAGILLYESVVGQPPFAGETPMSVAYQHVHSDVPVPSSIRADIPAEIDELVGIATARNPADRYSDAADFATHLRAVRVGLVDVPAPLAEGHHTVILNRDAATVTTSGTGTDPNIAHTQALGGTGTAVVAPAVPGLVGPPGGPWVQASNDHSDTAQTPPPDSPSPASTGEPRRPRRFRAVIALLVLTLLAGIVGVGAWSWTQAQLRTMPDVVGMTPAQAKARLASEGITLNVIGRDFSSSVPKGRILLTDPAAGGSLRTGDEVAARTSAGPQMVSVPKLRGDTQEVAVAALRKAQLRPVIEEEYSDSVPFGQVISTDPKGGASVPITSAVELVVSKGPPPVTVPNVVGQSRDSAIATLEAAGLNVVVANQLPVVVIGRVYSQDPAPDTIVTKGTTVTITLV